LSHSYVSDDQGGPARVSSPNKGLVIFIVYALVLAVISARLGRHPNYVMDAAQYMGNALLMEEQDPVKIHTRVYAEIDRHVPKAARQALLGWGVSPDESRQVRARDPYRFVEFLPLFAIRPLYNQAIWLTSKTGLGLMRSVVLISAASYFLMGSLLFVWVRRYMDDLLGFGVSLLVMISAPLTILGRDTTSDALATLIAFTALYLIFEKQLLMLGFTALLASIFFRTDFVVLAGPAILACHLQKRLDFWKAAVLSVVAVASVLTINHFAGDYGIQMLYYRNFVGTPIAPAETIVRFSFHDYLAAFRQGLGMLTRNFFIPFLLLGVISLASEKARPLFAVSLAYVVLHFLLLPNWEERWFGVFYLSVVICAAMRLSQR
jgi:hypothetical protein